MVMKYYELVDDERLKHRWHLGEICDSKGTELDCRDFTYGKELKLGPPLRLSMRDEERIVSVTLPLIVELQAKGPALDITLGAFDTLIVTTRIGDLLGASCKGEIQRVPVKIAKCTGSYEIINCTKLVDCIDTDRSEIEYWTNEDNRKDKTGHPKMITDLTIDVRRTGGAHLFRPKWWDVSIVVSETVKQQLEGADARGVAYRLCS
jgi:hypothetical protein